MMCMFTNLQLGKIVIDEQMVVPDLPVVESSLKLKDYETNGYPIPTNSKLTSCGNRNTLQPSKVLIWRPSRMERNRSKRNGFVKCGSGVISIF